MIRPIVSSATAIAFLPGQFATMMPRESPTATSIVLTPDPARTIELQRGRAACGDVTFVDRTTSTSRAELDASASRALIDESGLIADVTRRAPFRPSMPVCSNLSAMSTSCAKDS
jgi:hypothetical protein